MSTYPRRPIRARLPWLWRPAPGRGLQIAGLMLHSTRSGRVLPEEAALTERWWNNPINVGERGPAGEPLWGSYADVLIAKDGEQVICTSIESELATWTAGYGGAGTWPAGLYYIQVELAQGTLDEPFAPALVDSLAQLTAEYARRYAFPIARLPFLEQTEWPPPRGLSAHDACANGRKSGKTDPGWRFPWPEFLSRAQEYHDEEEPMTADERELLLLVASVTAGRIDGAPYATIGEALARFRALESPAEDARILLGQAILQADVLRLQQRVDALEAKAGG